MKESARRKVLQLYPEFHTVYGPYLRKDGRKVVILYDGRKRSARQLAKVKVECKIGRRLKPGEEVDHKDGDVTNDKFSNLQVLYKKKHLQLDCLRRTSVFATCAHCSIEFELKPTQTCTRALTKAGPFCSKRCVGKYGASVSHGNKTLKRQKHALPSYYKLKHAAMAKLVETHRT